MSIFDKAKITIAAGKKNKFDLSCRHITTSDFFQLDAPYIRHMIPGEKLSVNVNAFARLAGMPVPTFGDADLHLRAFFVPYRTVFPKFNDFLEDSLHSNAGGTTYEIPGIVPRFTNSSLIQLFSLSIFSSDFITSTPGDDEPAKFDFSWDEYDDDGGQYTYVQTHYLTLGPDGRRAYKLLRSLGYNIVWNEEYGVQGSDIYYSALPLLSFLRIYLDFYYPSQYVSDAQYATLMSYLVRDTNGTLTFSVNDLASMISSVVFVPFDNDYFTAAFDNPTGPNVNGSSSYALPDVSTPYSNNAVRSNTSDGNISANTPYLSSIGAATYSNGITQYAVDTLKQLTSFLKRHQLVGERAADRFLARFGISLSDDKLNRSRYLSSCNIPLVVGDVMSTADTDGANLGAYAGKGFLVGENGSFEFEAQEFGDFIITSSIVPRIGYVQGMDKFVTNLTRLDFFTPEFDGLGTRAIASSELYLPTDGHYANFTWNSSTPPTDQIFGFTPRYSEVKMPYDRLTGDFGLPTMDVGMSSPSWHLFRQMFYNNQSNIVHSRDFVRTRSSRENFNRIFYNSTYNGDHFTLNYNFKVSSFMPAKPLYDTFDFDHDEGQEITMRANGGQLN